MCEINRHNFKQNYAHIENSLKEAKFISIDLEFSALHPLSNQTPSLFDTNKERYSKLRRNLEHTVPLQIGIAAFSYDPDSNNYKGEVFNFYVAPAVFGTIDKSFYFQASSMAFLALHNFDFNKFFYSGVPYLNEVQYRSLEQQLRSGRLFGENCNLKVDFDFAVNSCLPAIKSWYGRSTEGDSLKLDHIYEKYGDIYEILYFLHKHIRNRFKNVWTYQSMDTFIVKKITDKEIDVLSQQSDLEDDILKELLGFSQVFKLLVSLQKPIIGHNLFQDLMIMVSNFKTPLPQSYSQFKQLIRELFPTIFDTKTLYYEIRNTIPQEKLPEDTSLRCLFNYFKHGVGRHLVLDTAAIECNIAQENYDRYHEASWDAFCTGYIFIRMGHFNLAQRYPKSKVFVSSEIIAGFGQYRNWVNVIRGSTSHVRLDGEDPDSNRPPWLIVESLQNEPLDITQLTSMFSSFGFVDVKKFSTRGNKVLVAVDTFRTARDISRRFKTDHKFRVRQYNVLKHSPAVYAFFLTTVTISGTLLVWLSHKMTKS